MNNSKRLCWFSIDHLWGFIVLAGIFAFVNTHPIRPHDFWWHIAAGREIVQTGQIPRVDAYTATACGQPYPSYQAFWLMDVLLYAVYQTGGPALIVFVYSLIITGAYALLFWVGWEQSGSGRAAAAGVILAAALGVNDWNVRPQGIAFLMGAAILWAIHRTRRTHSPRYWIVPPVAMLLWVNSHGSFPIGLILLGFWAAGELWQQLWPSFRLGNLRSFGLAAAGMILGALACWLNPRGPGVIVYLGEMAANPIVQTLTPEWAAPGLDTWAGRVFIAGFLFCAAIFMLSPRRPSGFQLFSFLAFGFLGLQSFRGVIWFGLILAPAVAEHLAALAGLLPPQKPVALRPRVTITFGALILAAACISLPWFKPFLPFPPAKAGLISAETPLEATSYLLDHPSPGPIFHAMSFGSYLSWAAPPACLLFVDSRIELFSETVWQDYLLISNAQPGWEQHLVTYGVQTLFLSPSETPLLLAAAASSPDWEIRYQDSAATILTRSAGR